MAPTRCCGWLWRSASLGFQLPSSAPSLRSSLGLAAEARENMNLEVRGRRRKMKWQSGKGGSAGCGGTVIKHSPHFSHLRVFGKPLHNLRLSAFSETGGPLLGLSRNCSLYHPFIATSCYCSPNIRRHLRHLLRLSNYYYTAVTLVFSLRFVFSKIFTCGSGIASSI